MTQSQRLALADPYRLEGEAERPWVAPFPLPDPKRVEVVVRELKRGLEPARPEFVTWICGKLAVLPTQNATGIAAAVWTDNVSDVCEHYPEDLLQAACLHLLKTKTFRPQPAEIVEVIDGKYEERKRMLVRAESLIPGGVSTDGTPKPFVAEDEVVRLRTIVDQAMKAKERGSFVAAALMPGARKAERRLAEIEERAPADWAAETGIPASAPVTIDKPRASQLRPNSSQAASDEPPPHDYVPEGVDYEGAAA